MSALSSARTNIAKWTQRSKDWSRALEHERQKVHPNELLVVRYVAGLAHAETKRSEWKRKYVEAKASERVRS